MRLLVTTTALLIPALLLSGCFLSRKISGEPYSPPLLRHLEPGISTEGDVLRILGAPTKVTELGKRTVFQYTSSNDKNAGLWLFAFAAYNQDVREDRICCIFDEKHVLLHFGSTLAVHRTQFASPWSDVHEESDREEADADRKGL